MLRAFATLVLVGALPTSVSSDQALRSGRLAQQLTGALAEHKLDAIAAQDPDEPDRFVAALFFPDTQLLVVSARHPSPALLQTRLVQKQYRDVYLDLQGSADSNSRVFFQDMKADGLCSSRGQAADFLYEGVADPLVFDPDGKRQKMSEHDLQQRLAAADEKYSRYLELLLAQVKGT